MPTQTVGLIGVGNMGMPVARRLVHAGYPINVFARRADVIEEARSVGANIVEPLARVGEVSDVVIVNVFSDEQLREVTLGDDGIVAQMRAGSTLVSHTTGRPSTIGEIAGIAAARGVHTLDAAMSGGPHDIEAGELTLLVGGDGDALEKIRPLLASYSDPILHVGEVGDGQKVKLLNNALFGAQVALVAHIERGAVDFALDPARVLPAIHACSGDSYALSTALMIGSAGRLVHAASRWIEKDVAVCTEVAVELGVDLESVLAVARQVKGSP
jgi:3-hydroxyisobutyrate dehydrogenase-like beta-hydroxyacid dehydrogenase